MSGTEPQTQSLQNQTLLGLQEIIDRGLGHLEGVERTIVSRTVQILKPRVEERILRASAEDLREEIKYLHELLGKMLGETSVKKSTTAKPKRKRRAIRR